jgi:hypothetical protein
MVSKPTLNFFAIVKVMYKQRNVSNNRLVRAIQTRDSTPVVAFAKV